MGFYDLFFESRNEDKSFYNCGGYALETFDWYIPYDATIYRSSEHMVKVLGFNGALDEMERYMLNEFNGKLRKVESEKEVKKNERLVLFRIGSDGWGVDFHYVVRKGWNFFHKRGALNKIERMKKDEVFSKYGWCRGMYDSEIKMFALRV